MERRDTPSRRREIVTIVQLSELSLLCDINWWLVTGFLFLQRETSVAFSSSNENCASNCSHSLRLFFYSSILLVLLISPTVTHWEEMNWRKWNFLLNNNNKNNCVSDSDDDDDGNGRRRRQWLFRRRDERRKLSLTCDSLKLRPPMTTTTKMTKYCETRRWRQYENCIPHTETHDDDKEIERQETEKGKCVCVVSLSSSLDEMSRTVHSSCVRTASLLLWSSCFSLLRCLLQ